MKSKSKSKSKKLLVQQDKNELIDQRIDALYGKVSQHIDNARNSVHKAINFEMVKAYWLIGREIVEEEQKGFIRAKYGKALIMQLGQRLNEQYGKGYSEANIKNMRQFYLEYQPNKENYPIRYTLCSESGVPNFLPNFGWSHY